MRDYAARITGVGTVASVPDEFVRSGEVLLVDLPAEALRSRIASGAVYSAEQAGGALGDYFRAVNLQALSELARAWIAGTGEAAGEALLARDQDAQLVVVHVRVTDGLTRGQPAGDLDRHRKLTAELGGTYLQAQGPTLAEALAKTARAQDAAIIVAGRHRSRLAQLVFGSVPARLRRLLPQADIREVPTS